MALAQNGYSWTYSHDPILPVEAPRMAIIPFTVFGVNGVGHLYGGKRSRHLQCRMMFDGFVTETALKSVIDTINDLQGTLVGDLTQTIGGATSTYTDCTFLGLRPLETFPRYDASGRNGWFQNWIWLWEQRNP